MCYGTQFTFENMTDVFDPLKIVQHEMSILIRPNSFGRLSALYYYQAKYAELMPVGINRYIFYAIH